jgi:hypothetical protein
MVVWPFGDKTGPCFPPHCIATALAWSNDTKACSKLREQQPVPGYGALRLAIDANTLQFEQTETELLYIFFRYSGMSRHDSVGESTPMLSAVSLHQTLGALDAPQAQATSVTVILNGDGRTRAREWFSTKLAPHIRRTDVIEGPSGNRESFVHQQR